MHNTAIALSNLTGGRSLVNLTLLLRSPTDISVKQIATKKQRGDTWDVSLVYERYRGRR